MLQGGSSGGELWHMDGAKDGKVVEVIGGCGGVLVKYKRPRTKLK